MSDNLKDLANAGVSIWLDDLSRERIVSGNLQHLIDDSSVVGVTTNPTIFAGALAQGDAYDEQLATFAPDEVAKAITTLTTDDVRSACDLFASTYRSTSGVDGRVSIEVEPGLAMKTEETIDQAKELWAIVDRPNCLIKIPATEPGLPAITAVIAAGISVNVTLIFGIERYRAVIDAYLSGLERAIDEGIDPSSIESVASFFVSRVDAEVDKRLDALGTEEAAALKGRAAIANARVAYGVYEEAFSSERWSKLAAQGANPQRPLWASTGVKNPDYPDTMYVTDLVVSGTVNTMPEKTMQAVAEHGVIDGDQVSGNVEAARQTLAELAAVGVDLDDVVQVLEAEGVAKFEDSWGELVQTVEGQLATP